MVLASAGRGAKPDAPHDPIPALAVWPTVAYPASANTPVPTTIAANPDPEIPPLGAGAGVVVVLVGAAVVVVVVVAAGAVVVVAVGAVVVGAVQLSALIEPAADVWSPGQSLHAAWPVSFWNWPAAQDVQPFGGVPAVPSPHTHTGVSDGKHVLAPWGTGQVKTLLGDEDESLQPDDGRGNVGGIDPVSWLPCRYMSLIFVMLDHAAGRGPDSWLLLSCILKISVMLDHSGGSDPLSWLSCSRMYLTYVMLDHSGGNDPVSWLSYRYM